MIVQHLKAVYLPGLVGGGVSLGAHHLGPELSVRVLHGWYPASHPAFVAYSLAGVYMDERTPPAWTTELTDPEPEGVDERGG